MKYLGVSDKILMFIFVIIFRFIQVIPFLGNP